MLTKSLKLLNHDRQQLIEWPAAEVVGSTSCLQVLSNIKLKFLVTNVGRRSVQYFYIARAKPEARVRDLTLDEYRSLNRVLEYPMLDEAIKRIIRSRIYLNEGQVSLMYPCKVGLLTDMRKMSSSMLRKLRVKLEDTICVYKTGLILNVMEVRKWGTRISKLTSVRHRSTLLRISHGDVYSNSRLYRFGIIDSPECKNCENQVESITHKILECPKAIRVWQTLNRKLSSIGLDEIDLTLSGILGADNNSVMHLTLAAEILSRFIRMAGKVYDPEQLVNASIRTVYLNEPRSEVLRNITIH
jgi:hypothetical protein